MAMKHKIIINANDVMLILRIKLPIQLQREKKGMTYNSRNIYIYIIIILDKRANLKKNHLPMSEQILQPMPVDSMQVDF